MLGKKMSSQKGSANPNRIQKCSLQKKTISQVPWKLFLVTEMQNLGRFVPLAVRAKLKNPPLSFSDFPFPDGAFFRIETMSTQSQQGK